MNSHDYSGRALENMLADRTFLLLALDIVRHQLKLGFLYQLDDAHWWTGDQWLNREDPEDWNLRRIHQLITTFDHKKVPEIRRQFLIHDEYLTLKNTLEKVLHGTFPNRKALKKIIFFLQGTPYTVGIILDFHLNRIQNAIQPWLKRMIENGVSRSEIIRTFKIALQLLTNGIKLELIKE